MKNMYGYIRVSDKKQEKGGSLQAQRKIISQYALDNGCAISQWFVDKKTAAKCGRDNFDKMLALLEKKKADGLIVHKIDRSARNLTEWAYLEELFDAGIDVRFAHDNLDLSVRGERLSADIQAIVAADYIRNLRDEVRKGINQRLEDKLYPFRAPVGYLDTGKGKYKKIDPVKGKKVKKLFELYASGNYSLRMLVTYAHSEGLTSLSGGKLHLAGVHRILTNPFYAGVIKIKRTGKIYSGGHSPIISTTLYKKVQDIMSGNLNKPLKRRHDYLFRQVFHCHGCRRFMIGEMQKGRVYYRCQNPECDTKTIREDRAQMQIQRLLEYLTLPSEVFDELSKIISRKIQNNQISNSNLITAKQLELSKIENRIDRLADAFLDNVLEADAVASKKQSLLLEKKKIESDIYTLTTDSSYIEKRISKALELLKNPLLSYKSGDKQKKRDLLEKIGSNFFICGRRVVFEARNPFRLFFSWPDVSECAHSRNNNRKMEWCCGSEEQRSLMNVQMKEGSIKKLADELLSHYSTREKFEKSERSGLRC